MISADKETALRDISNVGIAIKDAESIDELRVQFTVSRASMGKVQELAERKGERLTVLRRSGLFWPLWSLHRRPVLIASMALMLALTIVVPGRVLFVQVEGDEKIPERLILESARNAGIRFGASRRAVRSEEMKNELLGALPQLQWAGVNTYGCTAVISVRERAEERKPLSEPAISNMVAVCDGVITSCTATRGNLLCSVGQAVQKGQILISGYVDNGLALTATRAEGEIFAQTNHDLTVVMPTDVARRGSKTEEQTNFSLIVGKKRINFVKGSGIYDGTCVKMYLEYCLTLPGGFRLPVALVKETVTGFDVRMQSASDTAAQRLLTDSAKTYLQQHLVAATITDGKEDFFCADGAFRLTGYYACREMIGREQSEQIGDFHGKTD